jgi:hypothetical protein
MLTNPGFRTFPNPGRPLRRRLGADCCGRKPLIAGRELSVQLRFLTSLRTIDLAIISSMDLRLSLNVILSEILVQLDAEAANILILSSFSTEFDCLGIKVSRTRH